MPIFQDEIELSTLISKVLKLSIQAKHRSFTSSFIGILIELPLPAPFCIFPVSSIFFNIRYHFTTHAKSPKCFTFKAFICIKNTVFYYYPIIIDSFSDFDNLGTIIELVMISTYYIANCNGNTAPVGQN